MGASESTGRLNGTETEEEEERESRGGSSSTGAATIAIATAGAAVAAWGISRMLSAPLGLYVPTPEDKELTEKRIWFPPPSNRLKLNTDGAFLPDEPDQPRAYGGILRNHECKCIKVFRRRHTDQPGSLEAEIIGILKGLEFLVDNGHEGAILENDSLQAVRWINRVNKSYEIPKEKMARCKEMIDNCRKLADENNIAVLHIYRAANGCADKLGYLATKELPNQEDHTTDLPDAVKTLVEQDKTAYYRLK